ncbi:MAG: hypothetical protein HY066_04025 [Betaproteobacteria bacterium]|nr:hypothetical protein [Betaproteobacteria bacterium]
MNKAAGKLATARARLILDQPFLGALVLRLPLVEADAGWCRTSATDARALYYNPRWIEGLSSAQVQFALAHEALHCALGHFARRGSRVRQRWDLACDFAINPVLAEQGLRPPPEALVLDLYAGMTAEEIYPCIDDSLDQETLDQHLYDSDGGEGGQGGQGDQGNGEQPQQTPGVGATLDGGEAKAAMAPPAPLAAAEREQLAQQWQRHLAAAAQRAQEAGKLGGGLARLIGQMLQPVLPWRSLLAQYLSQMAQHDYSYARPSRREGEMIFPSLRSSQAELCVALDISGSVGAAELAQFVSEVDAIRGALPARVTLFACDAALAPDAPWLFEPWQALSLPRSLIGGGGTAFAPVFEWVAREGRAPDALLYFTDALGEFPAAPPDYPVLWLVKGKAPVPWGRRIQLN